jgi:hypothetical protein
MPGTTAAGPSARPTAPTRSTASPCSGTPTTRPNPASTATSPRPPCGTARPDGSSATTSPPSASTSRRSSASGATAHLRAQIEELDARIGPTVNQGANAAATDSADAKAALLDTFAWLDTGLAGQRYLLGDRVTEADVRLWVSLVRYDAQANAECRIDGGLPEHPNLWAYARDLYQQPAFASTTDFATFTAPGATLPDWSAPHGRGLPAAV